MRTTLIALVALMTTGMASAQMQGQTSDLDLGGLSFKLGIAFPVDNKLSDFAKNLSAMGIEFNIPTRFGKGTESYLAVDYFSKSVGQFGKGSVVAITYNQRFLKNTGATRQTYGFGGVGVGFSDITESDQILVLRGGVGINLSDQTFLEAAGTFSSSTSKDGALSTIGLYFGYRF
jgi:hypothetical protein